jgi:hypothetical protein
VLYLDEMLLIRSRAREIAERAQVLVLAASGCGPALAPWCCMHRSDWSRHAVPWFSTDCYLARDLL